MDKVICDICGIEFFKKRSQIKRSKRNFCSKKCSTEGRKNGVHIKCKKCGNKSYKQKSQLMKSENLFCSKNCSVLWKNRNTYGKDHPNWKGGEYSYKNIIKKKGVNRLCLLCAFDSQDVLIVHHIDRNRKNNSISNLVWLCRNCHFLVHNCKGESERLSKVIKNG